MDPNGAAQFKRSELIDAASTIVLCDGEENDFPSVTGTFVPARHQGGANFVFGDGHAQWLIYADYCRSCPSNPFPDNNSSAGGDWKTGVKYHWFPYLGAPN
jgi:prepilin-type processing-associated H-X9-DG protein